MSHSGFGAKTDPPPNRAFHTDSISNSLFSYLFRVDNPVDHYLAYCIIQNLFHGTLIIISKFQKKGKKGPRKKPEITNPPKGGGGYPHIGKRPIYFRFFLMKASLREDASETTDVVFI